MWKGVAETIGTAWDCTYTAGGENEPSEKFDAWTIRKFQHGPASAYEDLKFKCDDRHGIGQKREDEFTNLFHAVMGLKSVNNECKAHTESDTESHTGSTTASLSETSPATQESCNTFHIAHLKLNPLEALKKCYKHMDTHDKYVPFCFVLIHLFCNFRDELSPCHTPHTTHHTRHTTHHAKHTACHI